MLFVYAVISLCVAHRIKFFCASLKQIIKCCLRLTFNAAFIIMLQLNAALRQLVFFIACVGCPDRICLKF
jgi:hypothetical protein